MNPTQITALDIDGRGNVVAIHFSCSCTTEGVRSIDGFTTWRYRHACNDHVQQPPLVLFNRWLTP